MAIVSYVFDINDQTVWSPSLFVGDLYVRFATQIADMLGLPSGLRAIASDYYEIDPDVFEIFTKRMFAENFDGYHDIKRGMLEAVLAPAVVILDRVGRPLLAETEEQRDVLVQARELGMPR